MPDMNQGEVKDMVGYGVRLTDAQIKALYETTRDFKGSGRMARGPARGPTGGNKWMTVADGKKDSP